METVTRIRRSTKAEQQTKAITESLKEKLAEMASLNTTVAELQNRISTLQLELEQGMKAHGLQVLADVGGDIAAITRRPGRTTNTINVEEFEKLVARADFLSCVSVAKGKAEKVLSKKELAAITESVTGELGEPELVITYAKV